MVYFAFYQTKLLASGLTMNEYLKSTFDEGPEDKNPFSSDNSLENISMVICASEKPSFKPSANKESVIWVE